ncbi:MAG: LLM class flavin-dependent oxidoreductase [Acidimicrobiia bacterium]|nr:LLM class flavin-dependent oxidoreductase [Acidimicrobiia bacterium]
MEFQLFLPQMRMTFDQLVGRARAAESAGFVGISGMDHLAPPMAEDQPMYDAIVTTAWLAAHTDRLTVGSLVLCDAFRHPAVLAKQVVSLDHASGGRYELGIGWGSVPTEFPLFGIGSTEPRARVDRLRESLTVMRALWAGETVDFDGEYLTLRGARQEPQPLSKVPIVIGGTGPKTLALVRDFADWWNVHTGEVGRVPELRDRVGDARVSIQQMVAFVPDESERAAVTELTHRRFGPDTSAVIGTAPELVDHYGALAAQGVERVYVWFCDFAAPDTLAAFGREVIPQL